MVRRAKDPSIQTDTDKLDALTERTAWLAEQLRKIRNPYFIGGAATVTGPISNWVIETFHVEVPIPGWLVGPILIMAIGFLDYAHAALKNNQDQRNDIKDIKKLMQEAEVGRARDREEFQRHLLDHHGYEIDETDAWRENIERDAQAEARGKRKSKGKLPTFHRPKSSEHRAVSPPEPFASQNGGDCDPPTLRPDNRR